MDQFIITIRCDTSTRLPILKLLGSNFKRKKCVLLYSEYCQLLVFTTAGDNPDKYIGGAFQRDGYCHFPVITRDYALKCQEGILSPFTQIQHCTIIFNVLLGQDITLL